MIKTSIGSGTVFQNENLYVCFGNKNSSSFLENQNIQFGHQVHKSDLLEVSKAPQNSSHFISDSDGLFTKQKKIKLGVYTADCIPCFVYSSQKLYSLHLGWRSLQLGLFDQALQALGRDKELNVFIGPHIQFQSFEVGREVVDLFKSTLPDSSSSKWFSQDSTDSSNKKFNVSLSEIMKLKASLYNVKFFCSRVDTFINDEHHSYRRQSQTAERNISFAFLK